MTSPQNQNSPTTDKNRIVTQWLMDFTVQIRGSDNSIIVGTGIVVSMQGHVVTCAHVLHTAGIPEPSLAHDATVTVYFPQVRSGEQKAYPAAVAGCFPDHEDDVVLLQLQNKTTPLGPEQIAVLGRAEDSFYNPFRSYGYRQLDRYLAGHAHGLIQAHVEIPEHLRLQAKPVQLESKQLNYGMSGAAVLDIERNLVVGIVSEFYFPRTDGRDRDTAWAVNCRILSLEPLGLPLRDEPLPKQAAPQPQMSVPGAEQMVAEDVQFHSAPPPLAEWVGRQELLDSLSHDRDDPNRLVTGLIGFGGEGKSSLARRWVDDRLADLPNRPTGVFWWGFYDRPSVDEFFEAALTFISDGAIDPRRIPSANARAQVIAAMLGNGRYLFVLDGLEILQHQDGDEYGLLRSNDLRSFLQLFAAPGHHSFCLVTSRAPLLDLMAYTTYTHRDVSRVTPQDGRDLLRKLGVTGRDEELDRVVNQWDGHALTLSLVGTYGAEWQGGKVAGAAQFDPVGADEVPEAAQQRYAHVHRVLRRYDEHISEAERAFLTLFSAFRTPVQQDALARVFRAQTENPPPLQQTLAQLTDEAWQRLVPRLVAYRLVRYNDKDNTYTTHPLVRNHYLAQLTQSGQAEQTHNQLKDYYLTVAGNVPQHPSLDDLSPVVEAAYHACHARAYYEAFDIYWQILCRSERRVIIYQVGAYDTNLAILQQFFPGGRLYRDPLISDSHIKSLILDIIGDCLLALGQLAAATLFYERCIEISRKTGNWREANKGYRNLAELYAYLGLLKEGEDAIKLAEIFPRRTYNKLSSDESNKEQQDNLTCHAWIADLRGDISTAGEKYLTAMVLENKIDQNVDFLYSLRGIRHADYLRRTNRPIFARRITYANLEICRRNRWPDDLSRCHRVLGDLDASESHHSSAQAHYDEALKIARSISYRPALIEALLARGRWLARFHQDLTGFTNLSGLPLSQAFSDLQEALSYATEGGYRLYEADIRNALAWAHHAAEDARAARAEASRALTLSQEMGYHWGQVEAGEVVGEIEERNS